MRPPPTRPTIRLPRWSCGRTVGTVLLGSLLVDGLLLLLVPPSPGRWWLGAVLGGVGGGVIGWYGTSPRPDEEPP